LADGETAGVRLGQKRSERIALFGFRDFGADFIAERPTEIQQANILLNNSSPLVRVPVQIINVDQWANIRVRAVQPAIPTQLYYDRGFNSASGYGTLNLWPGPQASYQLELFTWKQLTAFPGLATDIKFPPAYANAIRKNLAVSIAPMMTLYGKTNIYVQQPLVSLQLIQQQANRALSLIRSYNAPTPIVALDPAFDAVDNQGGWNYALGTSGRSGN
jgi:hypothetical protein